MIKRIMSRITLTLLITLLTGNICYASALWEKVGSNLFVIKANNGSYRCPAKINPQIKIYGTVPESSETLTQITVGGNLTTKEHKLTQVYVPVSSTPGWLGVLGCRYGNISTWNYVIYNQTSHIQHHPVGGAWSSSKGQYGKIYTCNVTNPNSDPCTFD